ncbi:hypothetical protein TNCV_1003811 [Trichonephila clavipes]|nr:hypothetical protein TNCV_1003811 [Trichonephila clavipes]
MTNHDRTWGRKPRLIGQNRDNSRRREDDERDKEQSQTKPVLSDLLQGILVTALQIVQFWHDGAPAHFSIVGGNILLHTPGDGHGGSAAWLPRSMDFNSLDFFWGLQKSLAYEPLVATMENISSWIVVASADIVNTKFV